MEAKEDVPTTNVSEPPKKEQEQRPSKTVNQDRETSQTRNHHSDRGSRGSQSSDHHSRGDRKYQNDRDRNWRPHGNRRYDGHSGRGYNRRGRGNFQNRGYNNNHWRSYQEFSDTNVYVNNIPDAWKQEKLEELFAEFGEIESAALMTNTYEQDSRRIAFVNFHDKACAQKAINTLNGLECEGLADGVRLMVKRAYIRRHHDHHQRQRQSRGTDQARGRGSNHRRGDRNQPQGQGNTGSGQMNQGHSMNHNKNTHVNGKSRRGPPGISCPPGLESRGQISETSDPNKLAHQMSGNWGPNSDSKQAMNYQQPPQQQRRNFPHQGQPSHQQQQHPQHQQFVMPVMQHMQPMSAMNQGYPQYLPVDPATGQPIPMQVVDQNGVPLGLPMQNVQQPMQVVHMQVNGEWVQQMVPVQPQMHHQMPVPHLEPGAQQMMHADMHQIYQYDMQPHHHMQQQMHQVELNRQTSATFQGPPPGSATVPQHMGVSQQQFPPAQMAFGYQNNPQQ